MAKYDPDGVMAVLPADHVIGRDEEFLKNVGVGYKIALGKDLLITFGIKPNRPETGYGYIRVGTAAIQQDSITAFKVESFVEKPDLETAEKYVIDGNYMWNSGMFIWSVSSIIRAFEQHLPSISRVMEEISPALNTSGEAMAVSKIYDEMESISIDNGIMEVSENVLVIPMDVAWNDVGSWSTLAEVWGTDLDGNSVKGEAVLLDSEGCVISSPHKLTAIVGVDDLIVVDTPDAILVCHKRRSQDVRKLQHLLRDLGYDNLL
jgi:mannose-1-phosphate guanylyltransferase